jgi:hypothetical protein
VEAVVSAAFEPRSPGRLPGQGRVVVIMPARNSALTIEATVRSIPAGIVDQIVLVDNASKDDTVAIAERLGLTVVRHPVDRGFGGSVKRLFHEALAAGADFVVELHPDNQYDPSSLPSLLQEMGDHRHAMVLASRFLPTPRRALDGGMPWWKFVSKPLPHVHEQRHDGRVAVRIPLRVSDLQRAMGSHGSVGVVLGRLQTRLPADLPGGHRGLHSGRGAGILPLLCRGVAEPAWRFVEVRLGHADRVVPRIEVPLRHQVGAEPKD